MGLRTKFENKAIEGLNKLNLPNAMLIIPDGNGRWAEKMNLTIYEGHKAGAKAFANVIESFLKLNMKVLGAWGFSEDNWKRPQEEIDRIMDVIENVISENLQKMIDNDIKFIVLGRREKISKQYPSLISTIEKAELKTANNKSKIIALFVDYGERFVLEEFAKAREGAPNLKTYDLLSKINRGLPLFDMVLRTSGELRLSGFGPLASLAEFVSVEKNLPDLTNKDMFDALVEYSKRQRRLGGRPQGTIAKQAL